MNAFDTAGARTQALGRHTELGATKGNASSQTANSSNGRGESVQNTVQNHSLAPRSPAIIPPRQWAYGGFLLFGAASVLGGLDFAVLHDPMHGENALLLSEHFTLFIIDHTGIMLAL